MQEFFLDELCKNALVRLQEKVSCGFTFTFTFTEEILNGKLHFLCSGRFKLQIYIIENLYFNPPFFYIIIFDGCNESKNVILLQALLEAYCYLMISWCLRALVRLLIIYFYRYLFFCLGFYHLVILFRALRQLVNFVSVWEDIVLSVLGVFVFLSIEFAKPF